MATVASATPLVITEPPKSDPSNIITENPQIETEDDNKDEEEEKRKKRTEDCCNVCCDPTDPWDFPLIFCCFHCSSDENGGDCCSGVDCCSEDLDCCSCDCDDCGDCCDDCDCDCDSID